MKKFVLLLAALLAAVMCFSSCQLSEVIGKEDDTTTPETTGNVPSDTTVQEEVKRIDFIENDPLAYINMPVYRKVPVKMTVKKVPEEDYQAVINEMLQGSRYYEQIKDRKTQKGDNVNVDYKGLMDGKEFAGGSAKDQMVRLDKNSGFIEGFAEGIVGVTPGETVSLNLTFPNDYYEELAGKPVVFEITVNYIAGEMITPEFNDEFANKVSGGQFKTVGELEKALRNMMQEKLDGDAKQAAIADMWKSIMDSAEVSEYPKQQIDFYMSQQKKQLREQAEKHGMSVEEVMKINDITEEKMNTLAHEITKEDLVFGAIVRAENFEITEEEYKTGVERYAKENGATAEQIEEYFGKEYIESDLLWNKILLQLFEWAEITTE